MTTTPPDLAAVKRAARRQRAAREAYRRALLEARAFGYSDAEIGRAAGISRQAVRVILERATPKEETT